MYNKTLNQIVARRYYKRKKKKKKKGTYHKGPRGGAMSKAINPLMHCAVASFPSLIIY